MGNFQGAYFPGGHVSGGNFLGAIFSGAIFRRAFSGHPNKIMGSDKFISTRFRYIFTLFRGGKEQES